MTSPVRANGGVANHNVVAAAPATYTATHVVHSAQVNASTVAYRS
jgi:hypothetical protein